IDAMLSARASGKSLGAPVTQQPSSAAPSSPNDLAANFAAGGASPDTLAELQQIGSGAAHGIGSMFNNAANFVERQAAKVGIFPETAARDTAIQAAADQQFAQNAAPGERAAAIVAPMVVPMSGAMKAGSALKTG